MVQQWNCHDGIPVHREQRPDGRLCGPARDSPDGGHAVPPERSSTARLVTGPYLSGNPTLRSRDRADFGYLLHRQTEIQRIADHPAEALRHGARVPASLSLIREACPIPSAITARAGRRAANRHTGRTFQPAVRIGSDIFRREVQLGSPRSSMSCRSAGA